MEAKHTEGPWWRSGTEIGAGNRVIADVTCGPGRTAEAEANARIMASGLEMVEALESAVVDPSKPLRDWQLKMIFGALAKANGFLEPPPARTYDDLGPGELNDVDP